MTGFMSFVTAGLLLGGVYGLLALPLTLVWRTTGMFDFAAGAYVVVSGMVAADVGGFLGILAGLGTAVALAGVTAGLFFLFKAMQPEGGALSMGLATFGLVLAVTAGSLAWLGTEPRYMRVVEGTWRIGGVILPKDKLLAFVAALLLVAAVVVILSRTSLGLRMRAAAESSEYAELLGIPVLRLECGAFLVSGILYGIVGVLAVSTVGLVYTSTIHFSILALSAAVLLGLRGPGTAFVGGLAIGVSEALTRGYVGETLASVLPSVLILAALTSGIPTRGTAMEARP